MDGYIVIEEQRIPPTKDEQAAFEAAADVYDVQVSLPDLQMVILAVEGLQYAVSHPDAYPHHRRAVERLASLLGLVVEQREPRLKRMMRRVQQTIARNIDQWER